MTTPILDAHVHAQPAVLERIRAGRPDTQRVYDLMYDPAASEFARFLGLPISEESKRKIVYESARRLFAL